MLEIKNCNCFGIKKSTEDRAVAIPLTIQLFYPKLILSQRDPMDERHFCRVCDAGMNLDQDDVEHCPISRLTLHSQIVNDICTSDVLPPRPQKSQQIQ